MDFLDKGLKMSKTKNSELKYRRLMNVDLDPIRMYEFTNDNEIFYEAGYMLAVEDGEVEFVPIYDVDGDGDIKS